MNWNLSLTSRLFFVSMTVPHYWLRIKRDRKRPSLDKNRNDPVGSIDIPPHVRLRCEEASASLNDLSALNEDMSGGGEEENKEGSSSNLPRQLLRTVNGTITIDQSSLDEHEIPLIITYIRAIEDSEWHDRDQPIVYRWMRKCR